MHFKFQLIIWTVIGMVSFSSCSVKDEEIYKVVKTSYSIEDEAAGDKQLKLAKTSPTQDVSTYLALHLDRSRYNSQSVLTMWMEDQYNDKDYTLEIVTKNNLSYGTYKTVDDQYDVTATDKVYLEFVKGIDGWGRDMTVYSENNISSNFFKYENLNATYDLLTFSVSSTESGGKFKANLIGRFKIKK